MAAKILAFFVLLALSMSTTTAFFSPQCSPAPTNAITPQLAFTAILQQPIAQLHQQSSAHLIVHAEPQQQQFVQALSQVALANPTAYLQQQQLLHINPLAATNVVAYLQQQQLQQFLPALSQVALANPTAYLQHQQLLALNPVANVVAYMQQQLHHFLPAQQLLAANPLANVVAHLQQQLPLSITQFGLANAATNYQQQQLLPINPLAAAFLQPQFPPFNRMSLVNPALSWQQPILRGASF